MKLKVVRPFIPLALSLIISLALFSFSPDRTTQAALISWRYLFEMLTILPSVLIFMGLLDVWVSKESVTRHLGVSAGAKGIAISFALGSLPTGPLYIAFPIASGLRQKGMSALNLIVFLSAWACLKIPQELVELKFLGFDFMAARLTLTLISVILMGYFISWFLDKKEVLEPH